MDDLHTQIARLEDEIADLTSAAERCRKFDRAARITAAAGGACLIAELIGLIQANMAVVVIAISALLFGAVLYGSNRSTWQEIAGRLESVQAQRTSLIDELDLRLVGNHPPSS